MIGAIVGFVLGIPLIRELTLSWAGKALVLGGSSFAGFILSKARRG